MAYTLKYYCDKCGVEIPLKNTGTKITLNNYNTIHTPLDLCDNCRIGLTEVINTYLGLGRSYPNHNININIIIGSDKNKGEWSRNEGI